VIMLRRFALLLLALLLLPACINKTPYFGEDGPSLDGVDPQWENGNLGGEHVLGLVVDINDLTEEEQDLIEPYVVTVQGDFADCEDPALQFGSRAVTILDVRSDAVQVLAPPGPVRGGTVDISVTCASGASFLADAYDYVLGDVSDADHYEGGVLVDEDGDPIRRMAPIFENEYASFTLFYTAAPFINLPEPQGYGFFFDQPAPRASLFYGGNPGLVYAGEDIDELASLAVPAQVPEVNYEAPEQGDRIRAGSQIRFFRQRDTSEANEPLTRYGRKAPLSNPLAPDPYQPLPDGDQGVFNRHGVWFGVPFDDSEGVQRVRFLRVGNDVGRVCNPFNPEDPVLEGCTGDEANDDSINDLRIPLAFSDRWFEPEFPSIESLRDVYPHVAPELLAFAECDEGGGTEDECSAGLGIDLPSGTYDNVFICRAFDEAEEFPWYRGQDTDSTFDDGMCLIVETIGELEIEQGATYIDIPEVAWGKWTLDEDNNFYDGLVDDRYEGVGENVMVRDEVVFISYDEGFYRGNRVPGKNPEMEFPVETPYPMGYACEDGSGDIRDRAECDEDETVVASFDDYPYIIVPNVESGTLQDGFTTGVPAPDDDRVFFGFPALLPMPGEDPINWTHPLPDGFDSDGWDDTYFMFTLEVRDLDRPGGLDNSAVWRATAFGWADDGQITFPAESLATLPPVGDAFRPDAENQRGGNLLGIVRLQVHRTAAWNMGEGFSNEDGRSVFDVNTEWQYYFQNQHSCYDGMDNDGDGLCDAPDSNGLGRCTGEDGERLDPDPACEVEDAEYETAICQDSEDNDSDGFVDMDDPDCDDPNDVDEAASCNDDVDNDGDGWTDWPNDPGCTEAQSSDEGGFTYASDCNNSIDDDGDGRIDADDAGCEDALDDEAGDTCSDGLDNNGDGWIDGDDLTCSPGADFGGDEVEYLLGVGNEFECSSQDFNGGDPIPADEDGDGLANADDPDCLYGWDPSGESETPDPCHDLLDNDGDGWIDEADPQCLADTSAEDNGPTSATGNCNDGEDNDGDGWMDADDPECVDAATDNEVLPIGPLQCNDGDDNDGDGDVDADDADCPTGKDNHEE